MYVSYATDQPGASVGHPVGVPALLTVMGYLTWLTYNCVTLCQDDLTTGDFYSSNVLCSHPV
jgi:hypothetical protein